MPDRDRGRELSLARGRAVALRRHLRARGRQRYRRAARGPDRRLRAPDVPASRCVHETALRPRAPLARSPHDLQQGGRGVLSLVDSNAPTRVMFLLATLDGGGAQRTVLTLLPHLQRCGLDARAGLLARDGGLDTGIEPSRVVRSRVAPGWISYAPSPKLGRLLAGVPLVPLQQL